MRQYARFDIDLYAEIEELDIAEAHEFEWNSKEYRERKWESVTSSLAELCRLVNIDTSRIEPIINQLESHRL